jgi:hypothetical protein
MNSGLLKDLFLGERGYAPGAANGVTAPDGAELIGAPTMTGERQGGLLAGLGNGMIDQSGLGPMLGVVGGLAHKLGLGTEMGGAVGGGLSRLLGGKKLF